VSLKGDARQRAAAAEMAETSSAVDLVEVDVTLGSEPSPPPRACLVQLAVDLFEWRRRAAAACLFPRCLTAESAPPSDPFFDADQLTKQRVTPRHQLRARLAVPVGPDIASQIPATPEAARPSAMLRGVLAVHRSRRSDRERAARRQRAAAAG